MFVPGFENIIENAIARRIGPIQAKQINSGMIVYMYGGSPQEIIDLDVVKNTFLCLQTFSDPVDFSKMVRQVSESRLNYPAQVMGIGRGHSFRVRYSYANQFHKVAAGVMKSAENKVSRDLCLTPNRVNPDLEFWYIIRSEKIGFYTFLLTRGTSSVKAGETKGKLTPELASLIIEWAQIPPNKTIMDPFAGYGGLADRLVSLNSFKRLFLFDIESEKIQGLYHQLGDKKNIVIKKQDARFLNSLTPESIDAVITDPPWGSYESIDVEQFYTETLIEILRVLKTHGKMILLVSERIDMDRIVFPFPLRLTNRTNTLVNGKKAIIYSYQKLPRTPNA
jgi:16S rRNA G966 N2-methylase RsmD